MCRYATVWSNGLAAREARGQKLAMLAELATAEPWVLKCLGSLTLLCISAHLLQPSESSGTAKAPVPAGFKAFQWTYLGTYAVVMLADWLQGTHMCDQPAAVPRDAPLESKHSHARRYELYESYGLTGDNIGNLFLTGFLSSAVFGTFVGTYVDQVRCRCLGHISSPHSYRRSARTPPDVPTAPSPGLVTPCSRSQHSWDESEVARSTVCSRW